MLPPLRTAVSSLVGSSFGPPSMSTGMARKRRLEHFSSSETHQQPLTARDLKQSGAQSCRVGSSSRPMNPRL